MSVLVYIDVIDGRIQKSSYELLTFGRKTSDLLGCPLIVCALGEIENEESLLDYGADTVFRSDAGIKCFDTQQYAKIITEIAKKHNVQLLLFAHSSSGKSLAGYCSVLNSSACITGINALPVKEDDKLVFSKNVFSGKAQAQYITNTDKVVLTLAGNTLKPETANGSSEVVKDNIEQISSKVELIELNTTKGEVPLPEAELVVSAGRGMKGPENWGIIEELANSIGATTACSRPVADTGWRPHHEHVGQTGVAIRPNLYIAIGISGAIQHLAGVNQSKTIVVINKDPEAPFFKAADYGVCADLFDVVPKLTEAFKEYKNKH